MVPRMALCPHCSTEFTPTAEDETFCCKGCEFVYQLIHDEGLDQFYQLKQGISSTPVNNQPFAPQDYAWLEERVAAAESDAAHEKASQDFSVQGLSCIGCVWLIEKLFLRVDGALRADVFPSSGKVKLLWSKGACDLLAFAKEMQSFGYQLGLPHAARGMVAESLGGRVGLCGAFAMNAMVFSLPKYLDMPADFEFARIFELITFLSATLAMLIGGSWFIRRAVISLRAGNLHMDLPIALGIVTAYAGSIIGWFVDHHRLIYFDFVATFIFLMMIGRYLQTAAAEKNRNRLMEQSPIPLTVKSGDAMLALEELKKDHRFVLLAGQTNPVKSLLQNERATVSLEWINGEAEPVELQAGASVPAGAISLSQHELDLRAQEPWAESMLQRLVNASPADSRSPRLEKILKVYLLAVLLIGISGGLWWSWYDSVLHGLQVMISVFVISCPCALGVAVPMADELAGAHMRRLGVFIRRRDFWPRLHAIQHIAFDKTGTLTRERPELLEADKLQRLQQNEREALARLCSQSYHPLSRSILEAMGAHGQSYLRDNEQTEEVPALGIRMNDANSSLWSLGRSGWDGQVDELPAGDQESSLRPHCELRHEGQLVERFEFEESLRPSAERTLGVLRKWGMKLHIFSGDRSDKVSHAAEMLGIQPEYAYAGLNPTQKAEKVRQLDGGVLYLGDGANDTLAFEAATVNGSPATGSGLVESIADFYFLATGLRFLENLFVVSKLRKRAVMTAFTFALVYNLCAVVVCLLGHMTPLLAAVLMPLSSVVTLLIVTIALKQRGVAKITNSA